jgi:hypothetical protein
MSANNITSEKIDSSGFQSGGFSASKADGGGKKTPKGALMNDLSHPGETGKARIKAGSEAGKPNQNNKLYKVGG